MKRDEEQLVEGVLKLGAQGVGGRDLRRSLVHTEAKVQVASAMLHQVIVHEAAGSLELARELWPSVHRRWIDLAGHTAFREWLAARAEAVSGKEGSDELAKRTAAAFTRTVIPRIHGAIAVSTNDLEHTAFHVRQIKMLAALYGDVDADSLAVTEINWTKLIRGLAKAGISPTYILPFTQALDHTGPTRDRHALADEIAELVAELPGKTESIDTLERLAKAVPDHYGLRRLYARALLLRGQHLARGRRYSAAVLTLLEAREVDPLLTEETQPLIEACAEAVEALQQHAAPMPAEPQDPFAVWQQMAPRQHRTRKDPQLVRAEFDKALAFPDTREAKELRTATAFALYSTILIRLGLDPGNAEHRTAGERLLATFAAEDGTSRSELVAEHPILRDAPWTQLEQLRGASPVHLALQLPPVDRLPEHTPEEVRLRAHHKRLASEVRDLKPARARRMLALDWLASGVDVLPKLAAVAGAVMLCIGLAVFAVHGRRAARRDDDYARFRAAVTAKDPTKAVGAARDFLDVTGDSKADYRSQGLADDYAKVLLVEMRRAATANDSSRLRSLAEDARLLRNWYASNEANLPKKGGAR